jgi:predicted GNAT family N-acyltransferase
MNIIHNLSENHIAQLHTLYQHEWWTLGRSLEDTKQCVRNSQLCVGLVSDTGELIGLARVLTDYIFKALIFDVIVERSARGRGLGIELLSTIKNHERLRSVRHFELYCAPEMCPFYENMGFSANIGEIQLMRLTNTF